VVDDTYDCPGLEFCCNPDGDTDTGTGTDTGSDTDTGTDTGSDTDTGTDTGSDTDTGTDTGSDTSTGTVTTCITFEEISAPTLFMDTTALRNEYLSDGVAFTGPGALDGCGVLNGSSFSINEHSSPNFCAFNSGASFGGGGTPIGPETLTFSFPVEEVTIWAGSSGSGSFSASAYNASMTLVDSDSFSTSATMSQATLTGAGITSVVLSNSASVWGLDDLCFDH
jgi:hypothetical protein